MRAFLAIDINSRDALNRIVELQKRLLETEAELKPVEEKNMHFTIKFFGEIPETIADEVVQRLKHLDIVQVELTYRGVGVFPNPNRISVIWIGVDKTEEPGLINIAQKVEETLGGLPFRNGKRFLPHLTISRVKSGRNKTRLLEVIKQYENTVFGKDRLTSMKLKKSILTPRGPIYNDIYTHQFRED